MDDDNLDEEGNEITAVATQPNRGKKNRIPKEGDHVHYWEPHKTKDIGPAEEPCHAVIASVREDGAANLAILKRLGHWSNRTGVPFSEVPKTASWTWPA